MRDSLLYGVVGKKKIGKTVQTMNILRDCVKGDPAAGIRGRPVLIVDPTNEYSDKSKYPDIRALALEHVPAFAQRHYPEIRRIAPIHNDGSKMSLADLGQVLGFVAQNYYNGMLLVEDINKYISDNMPQDIIGHLCTNRHVGVDTILHYQNINRLSPKVVQNLNWLRIHKYSPGIRDAEKFDDIYDVVRLAEIMVDDQYNNGNIRFYVYVNVDEQKIIGDFTDAQFEHAVNLYLETNYSDAVGPYLKEYSSSTGKKKYTDVQAIHIAREKLISTYR